jgi:hypothetical protein
MMKEAMHWMLLSGSVLDTVLLLRVLGLRLQRIYAFITLDCVLSVLFDWVSAYLGWDSAEATRVFALTRFLYAVLTPLIAWDVFEEVKREVSKIKRLEAMRMALSLIVIGGFSFVLLAPVILGDSSDATAEWPTALALYLWGGACLTSTIFIWRTWRAVRKQETAIPRNTKVWSFYYMLTLASSVVDVGIAFSGWKLNQDILNVVLTAWLMGCTVFCLVSLRAAPVEMASENRD